MINLSNPHPTIPHPLPDVVLVPPIGDPYISVVPPSITIKGEEMESQSEDGLGVHQVILNEPLSIVMMEEESEEDNMRQRVESVTDPLFLMGNIASVQVNQISAFHVPKEETIFPSIVNSSCDEIPLPMFITQRETQQMRFLRR
jgi:hypothetical protein